jgi:Fibronectin type III domain
MKRPLPMAAAAVLLVAGLAAVPASSATSQAVGATPSPWCSDGRAAPCLERLWRDGVELTSADPTYSFLFLEDAGWDAPAGGFWWEFTKNGGYDMGSAESGHTFRALVNNGGAEPRTTFGFAEGVDVSFLPDTGTGHRVDLTVRPVSMIFSCRNVAGTTTCPHTGLPEDTIEAMAYGTVDNGSWWGEPAIRDQVKGLELFTNVHVVSTPPDFSVASDGTTAMTVLLQNSHEYSDSTLFEGFADYRVPHRLLREAFGIPDPSTMTGSSLVTTVSGTAAAAAFGQDGNAVTVDIGPITFSKRKVRVETGTITPTKPANVRTKRVAATVARVTFDAARPRGAKVRGYTAQCQELNGFDRETGSSGETKVKVFGLEAGSAYQCRVRARSSVGPGKWSPWVRVSRRP